MSDDPTMGMANPTDDYDRFTGWNPELENREALEATSTPAMMLTAGELPEIVDPRKHEKAALGFLQVENQGQIGSCEGNSLTECGEFCYMVAVGLVIQFSRMFAYIASQMFDGIRTDSGATLNGGTKAASEMGFLPEDEGPYPSKYPGWSWLTDAMRKSAIRFKLRSHTVLKSVNEVKRYIGSGIGIVQIGIAWNRSCEPDSNGCIRSWKNGGGGHALVLCGYVTDEVVGQKSSAGYWFLMKNSWSKRWGVNGYAYVDPAVVEEMLGDRWTVMIGRSDMEAPQPRDIPVDFTKPGNSMYG